MYARVTDALVRAIAPEREEEARQTRPHTEDHRKTVPTLTSVTVPSAGPC